MAIFEILFPLIIVAGTVSLVVLGTRAFLKGKEKRIAKRQAKRESKLSKKQEKQAQKLQRLQNSKGILKNTEDPRCMLAKGINCLHTVDNYNLIYKGRKGRKYLKLKAKQGFYSEVLDKVNLNERRKTQIKKKINKLNKKIVSTTKSPIFRQEVEPDYIKVIEMEDGKVIQDKKTYIQCFDENLAKQFRDIAESEMAGEVSKPMVAKISFNPKSNLAPLMISATSQEVYGKGLEIINKKMVKTIHNLDESDRQNAFPILLNQVSSDKNNKILIKNENDLTKFFGKDNTVQNDESQTK